MSTDATTYTENTQRYGLLAPALILYRVRQAIHLLRRAWLRILIYGVIFALSCTAYFFFKKPTYSAEISFVLDEQAAQNARNDFSDLQVNLGIGIRQATDASGSMFSTLNNVTELIGSRVLIEKTLKSAVNVNGRNIVLADFFLDSLNFREVWMSDDKYPAVNFAKDTTDEKVQIYKNGIMQRIYELVKNKYIIIDKRGKNTTIISATCTSQNELFSKVFIEGLIRNTEAYYTETKTQRAKMNLDLIAQRTDSIRAVYYAALVGRAAFTDENLNPARQLAVVSSEKRQTDILILRTAYIELSHSLELAKSTLSHETPLFQYLDTPKLPLKKNSPPLLLYFIVFTIAGVLLSMVYLLVSAWLKILTDHEKPLVN